MNNIKDILSKHANSLKAKVEWQLAKALPWGLRKAAKIKCLEHWLLELIAQSINIQTTAGKVNQKWHLPLLCVLKIAIKDN